MRFRISPLHFRIALLAAALALAAALPATAQPQPPTAAPATSAAPATTAAGGATGKDLFITRCGKCHGEDGKAATRAGRKLHIDDFTTAKWQKEQPDARLRRVIENGVVSRRTGERKMPAFKTRLTAQQIDLLVAHLRSLGTP